MRPFIISRAFNISRLKFYLCYYPLYFMEKDECDLLFKKNKKKI